jgi:predicted small lipoprotein YifL
MLKICEACRRHIKADSSSCPFCRGRFGDARVAVVGAAVALAALAGCGEKTPAAETPHAEVPVGSATARTTEPIAAMYGGPPPPDVSAEPVPSAVPHPPIAIYGAPPAPVPPSPRTTSQPSAPAYGGPPPKR